MKLYEIAAEHHAALSMLNDMEGLTPEIIDDSMAALNDELEAKVLSCAKYLRGIEAEAKAIKEAEQNMAARRKALEGRAASFKEYVRACMVRSELAKANDPEISITITKPRDLVVVDNEDEVPEEFVRTERKISKTDLGKALKDGPVAGAHIEKGQPGLRIS